MSHHRRAFVVGLGRYADPVLQAIESVFREHQPRSTREPLPLTQVRLLSHPPTEAARFEAECFDMSLSAAQLGDLYFDPHVRNWSSFNWQQWSDALPSTRLAGRLSAYYHATNLENSLKNYFDTSNTGVPVTIYLIAPLYDPFASGAVFDISSRLAQLAQHKQARFSTILMLPDAVDNPIEKQDTPENAAANTALRHATTYAALRELAFINSAHGFDITHRTPEDLAQTLNTQYLSPFIRGDCYVVGGSSREGDTGDDAPALTYTALLEECAQFVFLHTQTRLGAALTDTRTQHGLASVSSFSAVALQPDQNHLATVNAWDTSPLTLWTLELLRGQSQSANQQAFFDSETIQIPNLIPSSPPFDEVDEASDKTAYDRLRQDERRQQDDVMAFRQTAKRLSETSRAQQDHLIEAWEDELKHRLNSPDMRLSALEQAIESSTQILENRYSQAERLSDEAERAALTDATQLNVARANYAYLVTSDFHHPIFVILALITFVTLAILIWTIGQGFLSLMWLAFALTIPWIVSGWRRNQRETQAAQHLHDRRARFVGIQSEIAQKRAKSAHLYELKERFNTHIADHVRKMSELATALRNELRDSKVQTTLATPPVDTARLTRITLDLLDQAVREGAPIDNVLTRLNTKLSNEFGSNQQSDNEAAIQSIKRVLNQPGVYSPLLRVERAQIREDNRNSVVAAVGLVNYDKVIPTQLKSGDSAKHHADTLFEDLTPDLPKYGRTQHLFLIRLRTNIPLRALRDIETYQKAYERLAEIEEQNHRLRARAFFHPNRWGVATPDILRHPADITTKQPDFVQLLVISLRLGIQPARQDPQQAIDENHTKIEAAKKRAQNRLIELCQHLGVAWQPDIDYDALCGALCESPYLINEWEQEALSNSQNAIPPEDNLVQKALQYLAHHHVPKLSETYADWEIVAAHRLRTFKNRESSTVYRTLERIVAKHFAK